MLSSDPENDAAGRQGETLGGEQCRPQPDTLDTARLGQVELSPVGSFAAGSFVEFTLTYTAGFYGIDDSGAVRLCFRYPTDQSPLQFTDPTAPGFTSVEASNGAVLECRYSVKGNVRPWDKCLEVKVVRGYLREGDRLIFRLGDRRQGSPGLRLQTFAEASFEFRVLVDPIATYNFQAIAAHPEIEITGGTPSRLVAVCPTELRPGEDFVMRVKVEDAWGNPTAFTGATLPLSASGPVSGLPESLTLPEGEKVARLEGLSATGPGDIRIRIGETPATPVRVRQSGALRPYWADLHGQTEETIGTNSAQDYFTFARDLAFLDVTAHQGNDFQITDEFWQRLNEICEDFDEPGRFAVLPGYEWSGNTALGGDRNVFFRKPFRPIRRSSGVLVAGAAAPERIVPTARALFRKLDGEDAICFAHCGGRYADIGVAHDPNIETAVEVHSSWGSFEWLVEDAFRLGHRVGIVANSDGHKGRPGASYPGASLFGAVGGLTCLLMPELSRDAVFDALRRRHHYATTGGPSGRMFLSVTAALPEGARLHHRDPALGPDESSPAREAMMGDIVSVPPGEVRVDVSVSAPVPVERIELFNGTRRIAKRLGYAPDAAAPRLRLHWEGAEYRGRARQVVWNGHARLSGNAIRDVRAFNFFNPDLALTRQGNRLNWTSITTGNFAGVDIWLADPRAGTIEIETPLVQCSLALGELGSEARIEDRSDRLPRFLKIFRLPETLDRLSLDAGFTVTPEAGRDNPLFARITLEDGTRAWSSPIYLLPK
ncbi:DUF3604 domain-containing protein [Frigidibacter sp. ROC022]|uniref:DUF3604 domain-containing protein n=1 Tax=Frigidibacter sp. ROC022 TaxID=2971796 RepID=UPI00215B02CB|nr:DUF3604 domain-containing protein [Frigidibacter sp. ROC022]MCR8723905.1 DUF3604 domain-containing protein [Frigidibacter sp. ROC022]